MAPGPIFDGCGSRPRTLQGRIKAALDLYPCDVLFVHRDAEGDSHAQRIKEIGTALSGLKIRSVPVVPIRMQEAWLLIDEPALRRAAGNPNGRVPLEIPAIERLEVIPDPKRVLHDLLLTASEHTGRKRQKFNPGRQALRLGELIEDYAPLRRLYAFQQMEAATRSALDDASIPDSKE